MLTYHQRRRQQWRATIPQGCDQQGRHPEAAHSAMDWDDDPRNAKPLHHYVSDLWRGMSDGARFVFWLLMAILLVAAAWHVAARLPLLGVTT